MNRFLARTAAVAVAVGLMATAAAPASAQQARRGARIFLLSPVTLAQLVEVQTELKLTDEQKTKAADLQQELVDERQAIWQDAAGDWDYVREEMNKLNAELNKEFNDALEEAQQKRLREIYVQINGPTALQDPEIVAALKLSDEQKEKLEQAITDNRQKWFDAFQDFQSMSDEERAEKTDELIKDRDEALLGAITDEQKQDLDGMKGETLEVDLANLPGFGR